MVDRATALHQAAQVGAIVAALASGDLALLGRAIDDRIAEPARAPLIPGFLDAKAAAITAGALGASISGAGPTIFALAGDRACAQAVAVAMEAAFAAQGIASSVRVCEVDRQGARAETER
jgi:homoserine kinase